MGGQRWGTGGWHPRTRAGPRPLLQPIPTTYWLRTTHVYYLTLLGVGAWTWVSSGYTQGGKGCVHYIHFFWPFPASRGHWISRLVVSSLIFKFGPHHIPPTIAPGVVSPRDGAGKGVLLFRTRVMTLSPPGPSRMLPPSRGHSLASVTFSLFPT